MKKIFKWNEPNIKSCFPEVSKGSILFSFLKLFFIFAVLLCGVFYAIHKLEHNHFISVRLAREQEILKLAGLLLNRDLEIISRDLVTLAESDSLKFLLNAEESDALTQVQNRFVYFLRDRPFYDQVRYIDQTGQEIVRVNLVDGKPYLVPQSGLQSKARRYYFQQTTKLQPGEIFVSAIDLNMEHGAIEKPYKPVLRIALNLYDNAGRNRGIVLLNYQAKYLLDRFSAKFPSSDQVLYSFLNSDGYWLSAQNTHKEWGDILDTGESFNRDYPQVWLEMLHFGSGQMEYNGYIFSFTSLSLDQVISSSDFALKEHRVHSAEKNWFVVSQIEKSVLKFNLFSSHYYRSWAIFISVLFLLSFALWEFVLAKVTTKQYHASLKLLSSALEHCPAGVIITDRSGKIEYVNPFFSQLTGYQASEVMGFSPTILKSAQMSDSVYRKMWASINSGLMWTGEIQSKRKNCNDYWSSVKVSPIFDARDNITHFVAIQEDITQKIQTQSKLEEIARHDALTGIANRGYLMELLEHELYRCRRYGRLLSLLMVDIDHFKKINDQLGHQVGDKVLKTCVDKMRYESRVIDIIGRYGGEEFIIALPDTALDDAVNQAERLRKSISAIAVQNYTGLIHISIGCSQWRGDYDNLDALINRADAALYQAKEKGRNRVTYML